MDEQEKEVFKNILGLMGESTASFIAGCIQFDKASPRVQYALIQEMTNISNKGHPYISFVFAALEEVRRSPNEKWGPVLTVCEAMFRRYINLSLTRSRG